MFHIVLFKYNEPWYWLSVWSSKQRGWAGLKNAKRLNRFLVITIMNDIDVQYLTSNFPGTEVRVVSV